VIPRSQSMASASGVVGALAPSKDQGCFDPVGVILGYLAFHVGWHQDVARYLNHLLKGQIVASGALVAGAGGRLVGADLIQVQTVPMVSAHGGVAHGYDFASHGLQELGGVVTPRCQSLGPPL